ncbi:MAG: hypothetical protein GYB24_17625 [Rhodobacteraceae bacterium]|nr:hypothetical protein [Paracoccaceae bacterium]
MNTTDFRGDYPTSSGLPDGAAITYRLVADTKLQDVGVSIRSDNIDRIIIGRESGGLVVDKAVENTGTSAIWEVEVRDITPPYTSLDGTITQSLRISDSTECSLALPEMVTSGYVGGLKWECNGEVQPGASATLEFTARVDN